MQLVYRGISYQTLSMPVAVVQQVINGKHRGIPYQIRKRKIANAAIKGVYVLKYRGTDYIKTLN